MLLSELFSRAGVQPDRLSGDVEISGMVMDSRKTREGSLFVAMPSSNSDSHSFAAAARELGAVGVLAHSLDGFELAVSLGMAAALVLSRADLQVLSGGGPSAVGSGEGRSMSGDLRLTDLEVRATSGWLPDAEYRFNEAVWRLAKVAFGNPSASMKVIGVTGTNGKTTTAWLIRDMLCALGVRAGYLGTLGFQIPGEERELSNTTPFSIELNELLAEARDKGVEAIAMEVSSHALAERRVDGIEFDAAVFTNLTQDHLDFHGSMEAYEAAKLRLFTELPKQSKKEFVAAFNTADAVGHKWSRQAEFTFWDPHWINFTPGPARDRYLQEAAGKIPVLEFVASHTCFLAENVHVGIDSITFLLCAMGGEAEVEAHLGGAYNVENLLAAMAGVCILGFDFEAAALAAGDALPVPGRFEAVPNNAGIGILIDYAHTPDALAKLLDTVREIQQTSKLQTPNSKLITVFGCGGDRDRNKRPKMARAASERSDVTVVTSDNPRSEDPQAILDDVLAGIDAQVVIERGVGILPAHQTAVERGQDAHTTLRTAFAIIDRREAVAHAIQIAQPGDVVVIAGKGHENYQIIGRTKYPMDDRELAREGLRRRK